MTFVDKNAFDNLSSHSGEASPPRGTANGGHNGGSDDMQIDDSTLSNSDSESDSPARLTAAQKAKGKASRIRTASEAGLSPPPSIPRQFAADEDEIMLEDGQNVPYPEYKILEQGDSSGEEDESPATGGSGFMADARKTPRDSRQTRADIERDFQVAATLQEQESANPIPGRQEPRKSFASATAQGSSRRAEAGQPGSSSNRPAAKDSRAGQASGSAPRAPHAAAPATPQAAAKEFWKLFKYKGGVTAEELQVASKDGLEVRFWAPSFPLPKGVTFNTLTLFMNETNRESWRAVEGFVLIAWPADIGRADVDELVHTIRTVCVLVFNNPSAVKVFPADRNGDLQAPIVLIKFVDREQYVWMRDQCVINNSRRPFFVISRRRLPARITHTVTGGGWENDKEGRSNLEGIYRDAAAKSTDVGNFANEHHDAVDPKLGVTDYHQYLAGSITADPLEVFKRGTQTPALNWRIECARMTRDEDEVKKLNGLIKNLAVSDGLYGTPQVIRAPKCGMCGCLYHPFGKCEVAGHPTWLGERVKTAASKTAVVAEPEEDEMLPNGNMRRTAALLKEAPGTKSAKFDKNGKGKGKQ